MNPTAGFDFNQAAGLSEDFLNFDEVGLDEAFLTTGNVDPSLFDLTAPELSNEADLFSTPLLDNTLDVPNNFTVADADWEATVNAFLKEPVQPEPTQLNGQPTQTSMPAYLEGSNLNPIIPEEHSHSIPVLPGSSASDSGYESRDETAGTHASQHAPANPANSMNSMNFQGFTQNQPDLLQQEQFSNNMHQYVIPVEQQQAVPSMYPQQQHYGNFYELQQQFEAPYGQQQTFPVMPPQHQQFFDPFQQHLTLQTLSMQGMGNITLPVTATDEVGDKSDTSILLDQSLPPTQDLDVTHALDIVWDDLQRMESNKIDLPCEAQPTYSYPDPTEQTNIVADPYAYVTAKNAPPPKSEATPLQNSSPEFIERPRQKRVRRRAVSFSSDSERAGSDASSNDEMYLPRRYKKRKTESGAPTVMETASELASKRKLPAAVEGKEWLKPNRLTQGKNMRSANIADFDPTKYYPALDEIPMSWGPANNRKCFRYTHEGELITTMKFSPDDILAYLREHPLHAKAGELNDPEAVKAVDQRYVGKYNGRRYPSRGSDQCRFKCCPVKNHTILKGQYRVAFDEHADAFPMLDPYHMAGYVHLFCLEKFCDFPTLCKLYNVKPDTRCFPEGRNRMAITRDHAEFEGTCIRFIKRSSPRSAAKPYVYEETLNYKLTRRHLMMQPIKRQATREVRNGNSLDVHYGNLDVFAKKQDKVLRCRREKMQKRKRQRKYPQVEWTSSNSSVGGSPPSKKNDYILGGQFASQITSAPGSARPQRAAGQTACSRLSRDAATESDELSELEEAFLDVDH